MTEHQDGSAGAGDIPDPNAEAIAYLQHDLDPAATARLTELNSRLYGASVYVQSKDLPINETPNNDPASPYPTTQDLVNQGLLIANFNQNPSPDVTDFRRTGDSSEVWKFHLNVSPEDIPEATRRLTAGGYVFKYMTGRGGDERTGRGKVYTVYVGSFSKAAEVAPRLSEDLTSVLKRPEAVNDVEFAVGVVGRFDGARGLFTSYGPHGIQLPLEETEELKEFGIRPPYPPQHQYLLELQSLSLLEKHYGDYFYPAAGDSPNAQGRFIERA